MIGNEKEVLEECYELLNKAQNADGDYPKLVEKYEYITDKVMDKLNSVIRIMEVEK